MSLAYHKVWDSWEEYLQVADKSLVAKGRKVGNYSFTGTKDFAEAFSLAREGWIEGVKLIQKLVAPYITATGERIITQDYYYDVYGDTFDVARVIEGEPECWIAPEEKIIESRGRVVKLTFNGTVSAGISMEVIKAKGATICALVRLLELGGLSVELVLQQCCSPQYGYESNQALDEIRLKAPGGVIDEGKLAFALIHPSSLRRIYFAVQDGWPIELHKKFGIGSGYGWPSFQVPEEFHGDIHIEGSALGDPRWISAESAKAWVIEKLKEQGIELREER